MVGCSVLDLDAFERCNKAEGLGVSDGTTQAKNLQDTDNTCKLFRFLQLLCEGHNLGKNGNARQSPACGPPIANAPAKLRDYWTIDQNIFIRRRGVIGGVNSHISFYGPPIRGEMPAHRMNVGYANFLRLVPKIGYHSNVP